MSSKYYDKSDNDLNLICLPLHINHVFPYPRRSGRVGRINHLRRIYIKLKLLANKKVPRDPHGDFTHETESP